VLFFNVTAIFAILSISIHTTLTRIAGMFELTYYSD